MILTERIAADKMLSAINILKVIAHPVRLVIMDLLTENKKITLLEIKKHCIHIKSLLVVTNNNFYNSP